MNNPIDTNGFTHFLRFISLGKTELYQISEPRGFDSAEFSMKQNSGRFSRDNFYMADDQKTFTFYKAQFERINYEQVNDPQGNRSNYLDHGIEWIFETSKLFGPSGKIEYVLKKDGKEFTTGILGMAKADTNGFDEFACNIIQDENQSAYAKHADTKINVFADKNVKNEPITPAPTIKFLRKAIPVFQESELEGNGTDALSQSTTSQSEAMPHKFTFSTGCNNGNKSISYGIEDTLGWFQNSASLENDTGNLIDEAFCYLQAKKTLTNVNVKITDLIAYSRQQYRNSPVINVIDGLGHVRLVLRIGRNVNDVVSETILYERNFGFVESSPIEYVPTDFDVNIPLIEMGHRLYIYFQSFSNASFSDSHNEFSLPPPEYSVALYMKYINVKIQAISTALDTIVEGVRYIDMKKQCSKFIRNIPVNAAKFDLGGEFYNQVCYNRALIGQNKDIPFITTFKNTFGSVEEVCGDYEVNKDEIFVGQFESFYTNDEIGVFPIIPSSTYKEPWNDRFMINTFSFGYKTFEQNRDSKNTKEDVHTESDWILPDDFAQNKKEVKLEFIRSGFSQQAAADLEINKPTTSDDNDDKVYIQDIVELPPNSSGGFGAVLATRWLENELEVLNKPLTGNDQDSVINWRLLGIIENESFIITDGANVGSYTVVKVTDTVLTLHSSNNSNKVEGDVYLKMLWYYKDIEYTSRTNEGFGDNISGISIPGYFSNLLYTIRRNIEHWESYLNTACFFQRGKEIICNYFKNDVPLQTRFENGANYTENAPIKVDSLKPRILTQKMIKLECVAEFGEILELLEKYKLKRGFVRCYDLNGKVVKGYIHEMRETWRSNALFLSLEQKYEEENLILTFENGVLSVNDVYYDLAGITNWWKVTGNNFTAYDQHSRPICNSYHYSFIELNGLKYNSPEELVKALFDLEI